MAFISAWCLLPWTKRTTWKEVILLRVLGRAREGKDYCCFIPKFEVYWSFNLYTFPKLVKLIPFYCYDIIGTGVFKWQDLDASLLTASSCWDVAYDAYDCFSRTEVCYIISRTKSLEMQKCPEQMKLSHNWIMPLLHSQETSILLIWDFFKTVVGDDCLLLCWLIQMLKTVVYCLGY